jgi:prevent-host-death family protein
MKQVSLYEAKTHLSRLVDEAAAGEEIIITKNGKPLAKLRPLADALSKQEPRKLGQWAEQNKHIDWEKWDRDFKAADKEIEVLFNDGDVASALDDMTPKPKRSKVKSVAEKAGSYKAHRKGGRRG